MLARATPAGTIGCCEVSRTLSSREQTLQSFVASWRSGIGFGWRFSPAGGLVATRSVAATFGMSLEFEVVVVGQEDQAALACDARVKMRGRSHDFP